MIAERRTVIVKVAEAMMAAPDEKIDGEAGVQGPMSGGVTLVIMHAYVAAVHSVPTNHASTNTKFCSR